MSDEHDPERPAFDRSQLRGNRNLRKLADIPDRKQRESVERGLEYGLEASASVSYRSLASRCRMLGSLGAAQIASAASGHRSQAIRASRCDEQGARLSQFRGGARQAGRSVQR